MIAAYAALLLTSAVGATTAAGCTRNPSSCHELAEQDSWAAAKVACAAELEASSNAETALDLARAHMGLDDKQAALDAARRGLALDRTATALRIVGTAQDRLGTPADVAAARTTLTEALGAYEAEGDDVGVARTALAFAGSFWRDSQFATVDHWIDVAEGRGAHLDDKTAGMVAIMRGDLARRIGGGEEAEAAYVRAEAHLRHHPAKLSWLLLKRGRLHLERGAPTAAATLLEDALELAAAAGGVDVQRAAILGLGEVAQRQGRPAEGLRALEEWDGGRTSSYLRILARLTADTGDAAAALALLDEAIRACRDNETLWDLHLQRGRALEQLQRPADAESAYRAAIEKVEAMRTTLQGSELQPWLLSRRREPYEALFRMLAERNERRELLRVLESLTARSFLDFASSERPAGDGGDLLLRAAELESLHNGLLVDAGVADTAGLEALVVVEADGRLWTIHRSHNGLSVEARAESATVRRLLRDLDARPNDVEVATQLGELLVPPSVVASDDILRIVPAGELLRVPWAALRPRGQPLILQRPLAIAPSLALLGSLRPAQWTDASLVLGDPDGSLGAARDEARHAAATLQVAVRLGAEATRSAVYEVPAPWVLHVASHAAAHAAGGALRLADGPLTAGDVLEAGLAARVVVLSGCATARSRNREMWGSLAAAFLANGTGTVLATLRSVDDAAASALIASAYRHGLRTDPVRALAAAQREHLTRLPIEAWSGFVAYDVGTLPD
jgi:tetratricopeptide (TPR) repeat protein